MSENRAKMGFCPFFKAWVIFEDRPADESKLAGRDFIEGSGAAGSGNDLWLVRRSNHESHQVLLIPFIDSDDEFILDGFSQACQHLSAKDTAHALDAAAAEVDPAGAAGVDRSFDFRDGGKSSADRARIGSLGGRASFACEFSISTVSRIGSVIIG